MSDQPKSNDLAAKLAHCQAFKETQGVAGCAYLLRDGRCGFRRLREGPRRGEFPSLAELETCPREDETRRSNG